MLATSSGSIAPLASRSATGSSDTPLALTGRQVPDAVSITHGGMSGK